MKNFKTNKDLILFLESFLKGAEKTKNNFCKSLSLADKQAISSNFQSQILSFLDYIHNNFPNRTRKYGKYFKRPGIFESEEEFLKKLTFSTIYLSFMKDFYELNKKYDNAISYINSKVKHEKPDKFNNTKEKEIKGKLISNNPSPIQHNSDGSTKIGSLVFKHNEGSKIIIEGVVVSNGENETIIEHLEIQEKTIIGDRIIFPTEDKSENNLIIKEFKFTDWADNCMSICSKTLINFKIILSI